MYSNDWDMSDKEYAEILNRSLYRDHRVKELLELCNNNICRDAAIWVYLSPGSLESLYLKCPEPSWIWWLAWQTNDHKMLWEQVEESTDYLNDIDGIDIFRDQDNNGWCIRTELQIDWLDMGEWLLEPYIFEEAENLKPGSHNRLLKMAFKQFPSYYRATHDTR